MRALDLEFEILIIKFYMKMTTKLVLLLCALASIQAQNPLQALRSKLLSRSAMTPSHMPTTLDNADELREAQADLFKVNAVSGWLLLYYVGGRTVHFFAGGHGGVEEFIDFLEDDQIQYGVIRLGNIQEKGTLKTTFRDVFFTWIGPAVEDTEKNTVKAYQGDIQSFLQPFHTAVTITNKDHLNRKTLLDRSHPLSGSHIID